MNFAYTGKAQSVTLEPGKYVLECWGAQGGYSWKSLHKVCKSTARRHQVRIAAKHVGYVEKSNIKNPNTPAATTTKKYPFVGKVTASKLNVRKKPGTEHPLLPEYPMLNKDNLVNALGVTKDTKGDRWYKVSITQNEYVGYVSAKYITKA